MNCNISQDIITGKHAASKRDDATRHHYRILGEDDGHENETALLHDGMLMFYEDLNSGRTASPTLLLRSRMPGCVAACSKSSRSGHYPGSVVNNLSNLRGL